MSSNNKSIFNLCFEDCISALEDDLIPHYSINHKPDARNKMIEAVALLREAYKDITDSEFPASNNVILN